VAIEILDGRYCQHLTDLVLPKEATLRAIRAVASLRVGRDGMRDFHLHRVTEKFRTQHPAEHLNLLDILLRNLSNLSSLRGQYDIGLIADEIVRRHPKAAWPMIAQKIQAGTDDNSYDIIRWLGDSSHAHAKHPGIMRSLDPNDVIGWIGENAQQRVTLMCGSLPKTLDPVSGGSVTKIFIERFGEDPKVGSALVAHFLYNEAWMGPRSDMVRAKRNEARKWLELTLSPVVRSWIERYIERLNLDIEMSSIDEERDVLS
jgi:hypothetical protein